jgi:hypothetical protein
MSTFQEDTVQRLPKIVSNLLLATVFWFSHYVVLVMLNPVNVEPAFLLQMGLLIVSGIFLVRTLFNILIIADHLTKSFFKRLGVNESWSRKRILKDTMCIIAVLLVGAGIYPLFELVSNFDQVLQQITNYVTLGLIFLFVFDIGRIFYRITEKKANSMANRFSNLINDGDKTNGK